MVTIKHKSKEVIKMTEIKAFNYRDTNGDVHGCETLRLFIETALEDKFVQQELEDYDIFESQLLGQGQTIITPDTIEVTVYGQVVTFNRIGWALYEYGSCTL